MTCIAPALPAPSALFTLAHRIGPPPVALTAPIATLLAQNAPVAVATSGGKDSCALGFAVAGHLDAIGHTGPRLLIHADLGRVEWQDSQPSCQRLADALGWELVTVRRQAGDLMDRWLVRWRNNCARYAALECVKLILPWSTPQMRFCTSEMKGAILCRYLVERFLRQAIISAIGIRREESSNRAKAEIAKPQSRLTSASYSTSGWDWHPIIEWLLPDVLASLSARGFRLHEAYTDYDSSRVSCIFCILAKLADLIASTRCPENHATYREMCDLEIVSTFSFQDRQWLADVAPYLLDSSQRDRLADAKARAAVRERAEGRLPKHLLYTAGWPTSIPTWDEAQLLAEVRLEVADAVGILGMQFTEPDAIRDRYAELMETARRKAEQKRNPKTTTKLLVVAANGEPVERSL